MKRILKSLLSAGLAISLALPGTLAFAASGQEEELRYSYKMDGVKNEFQNQYGYTGGSDKDGGKKPGISQVAGKYGSASRVDIYGYKSSPGLDYGAVVFQFFHQSINAGFECIHFDDYVQEAHTISFWTRTPMMGHNAADVNTRKVSFSIATGNSGRFSKTVELPNTDQWNYVVIPFEEMTGSNGTLKDALASGSVGGFNSFEMDLGKDGQGFFGARPTEETREGEDKMWKEYIIFDEFLFDRSTPENPALIPASTGEDSYLTNANIKTMAVDGVPVAGFDPKAKVNEIAVPGYYTADDILEHVSALVAAPAIEADSLHQPVSGATYKITAPASVPGEGSVTVYAADYSDKRTYQLRFVARNGFQVNAGEITGIDFSQNTVPGGNTTVMVPIVNESASETEKATVIGVVRDTQTGEIYSIQTAETGEIAPGANQSVSLGFNVPGNGDYCAASLYFVDDLTNLETVYSTITTGDNAAVVTKNSKAKLTSKKAVIDNGTGEVTISGTVADAQDGETVNIAVYQPGAADKTAATLVNFAAAPIEDGNFTYTYTNNASTTGSAKIDLGVGGKVQETSVYMADEGQVQSAMTAYQALTADSGNEAYVTFMNTYGGAIGCPMELYNDLDASAQADAVKAVVGKNYDYNTLSEKLSSEIAFAYLNSKASAAEMAAAFRSYEDSFGFDTSNQYYQQYIHTDARLTNVFEGMKKETYKDKEEASAGFDSYVALCAINNVRSYTEIVDILNYFKKSIDDRFSYSKYNALTSSQKQSFASKVKASNALASYTELNSVLTRYIASLNNGNSNTSSGPSTSGRNPSNPVITVDNGDVVPQPTEIPVINTSRFSDMAGVEWAVEAVDTLYDLGIVSGDGTGRFLPDGNVTREEFAKMVVGAFGLQQIANPVSFHDVDEGAWYADYISIAAQHGIVLGDEAGNFGVGQFITRQDMAVMILRALETIDKKPDTTVKNTFADDKEIADYAKAAVYGMSNAGIVNGVGENNFAPVQNATRAEAAKMLYGVYQYAALGK